MAPLLRNVTGLLTMTEDQPRAENGVAVDPGGRRARGREAQYRCPIASQ